MMTRTGNAATSPALQTARAQADPGHMDRFHRFTGRARRQNFTAAVLSCATLALLAFFSAAAGAQTRGEIDDITGRYEFLGEADLLAILEEEGSLKGYVDVLQPDDVAADDLLSYTIVEGTREKNRVEFKTSTIHRKFYRFTGAAERGSASGPGDADYLRLVGDLEIVTVKGGVGEEISERRQVVFKSLGPSDEEEEE